MKGSKGLILPMMTGLMVFFIMLGIGAIEYGGNQGEAALRKELSTQAFWLAEAGIGHAGAAAPAASYTIGTSTAPVALGAGGYWATITRISNIRWNIISHGVVAGEKRHLSVQVGPKFGPGVYFSGPQAPGGGNATSTPPVEENVGTMTFADFFGKTLAQVEAVATLIDCNTDDIIVSGLTVVDRSACAPNKKSVSIKKHGGVSNGILIIVDGDLTLHGGTFNGIIWVEASSAQSLHINAGTQIVGAVYVNNGTHTSRFNGTADVNDPGGGSDEAAIANAQAVMDAQLFASGLAMPGDSKSISWRECAKEDCT